VQAKKDISEKTYDDFIIGDQKAGILAFKKGAVIPFWEDGGA